MAAHAVRLAILAAATVAAGCYHGTARPISPAELAGDPGWTVVQGLHVIRQSGDRDCGAAALAMMLQRWSVAMTPAEILRAVPREPGHGIALGALRDVARQKGLDA